MFLIGRTGDENLYLTAVESEGGKQKVCEALSILMKPELDELKEKINKTEAALASEKEEKAILIAEIEN